MNESDMPDYKQYVVPPSDGMDIKCIVVPHASYAYSGFASEIAYASAARASVTHIILLCTRHSSLSGMHECTRHTRSCPACCEEHSYAVQLPFLTKYFPHAAHTAFLVGPMTAEERVAAAAKLDAMDNGDATLFVISGDFMHVNGECGHAVPPEKTDVTSYTKPLEDAYVKVIGDLNKTSSKRFPDASLDTICGRHALELMTQLTCLRGYVGSVACYYTSQHCVRQPRDFDLFRVIENNGESCVSYISMVYTRRAEEDALPRFTPYEKEALLHYVREVIRAELEDRRPILRCHIPFSVPSMRAQCGVFVTFKKNRKLRGCIGTTAAAPLLDGVRKYALHAGFHDLRVGLTGANSLTHDELADRTLQIDITFLGRPRPTTLDNWQLGQDGIIIKRWRSGWIKPTDDDGPDAIYLPDVPTDEKWDRPGTLRHLVRKMDSSLDEKGAEEYIRKGKYTLYSIPGTAISSTSGTTFRAGALRGLRGLRSRRSHRRRSCRHRRRSCRHRRRSCRRRRLTEPLLA